MARRRRKNSKRRHKSIARSRRARGFFRGPSRGGFTKGQRKSYLRFVRGLERKSRLRYLRVIKTKRNPEGWVQRWSATVYGPPGGEKRVMEQKGYKSSRDPGTFRVRQGSRTLYEGRDYDRAESVYLGRSRNPRGRRRNPAYTVCPTGKKSKGVPQIWSVPYSIGDVRALVTKGFRVRKATKADFAKYPVTIKR